MNIYLQSAQLSSKHLEYTNSFNIYYNSMGFSTTVICKEEKTDPMRLRNVFKSHTYKVMGLECSFTQSSLPSSIKKKKFKFFLFLNSSIQLLSCIQLSVTPWTAPHWASLSITNFWSLPKLLSIESGMLSFLIISSPFVISVRQIFSVITWISPGSTL